MADDISSVPDTYLKDVASAVATVVGNVIGHPFVLTTEILGDVDEDEIDLFGPGAQVELLKYQGVSYDLVAQKEKGPARTIKMELRHR